MSYNRLLYHIIFRPKYSVSAITIEYEDWLYRYIWGIVKERKGILYRIGGMPDHIHMLVQLSPTVSLSDFMRDLKTATHKYLHDQKDKFPLFENWGKSYAAFTCSAYEKDKVINYIKQQKQHHQTLNFQDELIILLRDHGVDVNGEHFLKE